LQKFKTGHSKGRKRRDGQRKRLPQFASGALHRRQQPLGGLGFDGVEDTSQCRLDFSYLGNADHRFAYGIGDVLHTSAVGPEFDTFRVVFVAARRQTRERNLVPLKKRFQGIEFAPACLIVAQPQDRHVVSIRPDRRQQIFGGVRVDEFAAPLHGDNLLGNGGTQIAGQTGCDVASDPDFRRHTF